MDPEPGNRAFSGFHMDRRAEPSQRGFEPSKGHFTWIKTDPYGSLRSDDLVK
jgi:hypothetical protein